MKHRVTLVHLWLTLLALTAAFALSVRAEAWISQAKDLPDLGAPPQGEVRWVARNMRMNGLPMTVQIFESRLSADAVLAHYESAVKTVGTYESRRSANSPSQVLTLKSQQHFITITAHGVAHGSEGTILVSPTLERASLRVQTKFPHPRTATIINLQQYDDAGMESEHISFASDRAPFVELQEFSQLLIGEGWSVMDTRPAQPLQRGYLLEAHRRAEHARLLIMPDASQPGQTAIIVAWRKS